LADAPPAPGNQSISDQLEQLRVQEEVAKMHPQPPEDGDDGGGRKRQYLVVMRHGQRADEVRRASCRRGSACGALTHSWAYAVIPTADRPRLGDDRCAAVRPAANRKGRGAGGSAAARLGAAVAPRPPALDTRRGAGAAERLPCLQARVVADKLKPYNIQQVFISPFYRYATLAWSALSTRCSEPCYIGNHIIIAHARDMPPLCEAVLCKAGPACRCRCIQTARLTTEGLNIPPERWTVSVAVCEVRCTACVFAVF